MSRNYKNFMTNDFFLKMMIESQFGHFLKRMKNHVWMPPKHVVIMKVSPDFALFVSDVFGCFGEDLYFQGNHIFLMKSFHQDF